MQFPESWLRTFCDPSVSTKELADILTMAGLEVEELRPVAPPFSSIVVGEITEAAQHPNADRRFRRRKPGRGVHASRNIELLFDLFVHRTLLSPRQKAPICR